MTVISANNRTFYAIHAAGFAANGTNTYRPSSGVQSAGVNTSFSQEQVLQLGQLELYELSENIPAVEATFEKVLDGAALLQHLATPTATASSLSGRFNNQRAMVQIAYYPDTSSAASGVPLGICSMSGMYVSTVGFNFSVDGPFTESVTLVGNDKAWATGLALGSGQFVFSGGYNNLGTPPAADGVQRRENLVQSGCLWPTELPGIDANGINQLNTVNAENKYNMHAQTVTISCDLGRTELFELGQRGPYHRFVEFPTEVTCSIEITSGEFDDFINAAASASSNTSNQVIYFQTSDNTRINLGNKNKLQTVNSSGGDTGGGNRTVTYNYSNFNAYQVLHPADPAGLTAFV